MGKAWKIIWKTLLSICAAFISYAMYYIKIDEINGTPAITRRDIIAHVIVAALLIFIIWISDTGKEVGKHEATKG